MSTEHTDDQSSHSTSSPGQSSHSTSPESQIADSHPASKGDGDQYSVEILGGASRSLRRFKLALLNWLIPYNVALFIFKLLLNPLIDR